MANLPRLQAPDIFFTPIGNWSRVESMLFGLAPAIKASADWGQRKAGEKLVKIVKGHIDKQDLGWDPLVNPELSNDPRILVDHGTYRNNIKSWQSGGTRYVGVKKGVINAKGHEVWKIAAIHEYKSLNGGPYRALWKPSIEELGGKAGVANIIQAAIAAKIQRLL